MIPAIGQSITLADLESRNFLLLQLYRYRYNVMNYFVNWYSTGTGIYTIVPAYRGTGTYRSVTNLTRAGAEKFLEFFEISIDFFLSEDKI